MRISLIFVLLTIFTYVIIISDGREERSLHITSLEIKFDKTDATFIVNYDFSKLSKTFLLFFGAKDLEPKIRSIFPNFEYDIVKIDQKKTILRVKNVSVLNKGYYLHSSYRLGDTIETVYISDSSGEDVRKYTNINSTPYYFYRQ